MIEKIENLLEKHKYAISIFIFFFVYNFVIVGNFSFSKISNLCYLFHLVDFSIGLCSELLPGAIYNALFSTTQVVAVNLYVNILYYLFLLAVSFMLEKFLYKFDSKNRFIAFIIVLFFITGPSTFAVHTTEIGMLDMYWLFLAVAFLVMVQKKYLKWFIPIIFVLSVFIHVGAVISFIPFFALILLFEASQNEKVSKSYMFIFAISVFLAVAVFIYFVSFEESNLILSRTAFRELMDQRNKSDWGDSYRYYEYVLYRILPDGIEIDFFALESDGSFLSRVFSVFLRQLKGTIIIYSQISKQYFVDFAWDVLVSMPIVAFLYKCILSFYKKDKENRLRCFIWFCALCLLPFTFVIGMFCSVDIIKWFGHGVICLFTIVIYGLYKSPDNDYIKTLNNCFNNSSKIAIIVYWVFYMMCTVEPYT